MIHQCAPTYTRRPERLVAVRTVPIATYGVESQRLAAQLLLRIGNAHPDRKHNGGWIEQRQNSLCGEQVKMQVTSATEQQRLKEEEREHPNSPRGRK